MTIQHTIDRLQSDLRAIEAPEADLRALYIEMLGVEPESTESMRDDLRDYIRERCFAEGVHVSRVFGNAQ
ncbi:MAG: hypothetical protein KGJ38_08335 [Burkholderiaceae bacterium]|nr:hypothetical protein [Burkholderiaceae bacterium]